MTRNGKKSRSLKNGYEKLAFGSVNDAVRLLFGDEPEPAELEKMDFGNIAEIRRLKDGALEIKFYDRLRALDCLRSLSEQGAGDSPLYRALQQCAKETWEEKKDGA
ncbi:hypothetical protein [Caproicibacter sp.]|uniref:hypothetical protein n=1 Tax=Caproicibacter sp. TaxID=2814884 RepID=UPI003989CD0E